MVCVNNLQKCEIFYWILYPQLSTVIHVQTVSWHTVGSTTHHGNQPDATRCRLIPFGVQILRYPSCFWYYMINHEVLFERNTLTICPTKSKIFQVSRPKYRALREKMWCPTLFMQSLMRRRTVITTGDVAEHCQVSYEMVKNWIMQGKLPAFETPGGHHRILIENFKTFLASYGMPAYDHESEPVVAAP